MNILVVEDEPHTAALLKEMIEADPEFMVVKTIDSVADTIQFLAEKQGNIDLIFLDIHLSDGHSFEIFKHVDVSVPIVFCTAYDEYSLQAIKHNGIDYILKPFQDADVREGLEKYKSLASQFQQKVYANLPAPKQRLERSFQRNFITQVKDKSFVVRIEDIALFYIDLEIVYLMTFQGKKYPLFKKLEYIESVCDSDMFFRVNRQMLLHRNAVLSFEQYFNRKLIVEVNLDFPERIVVSRLKGKAFQDWLQG